MKVIQYNAITINGFIATKDGNSDWVSETGTKYFLKELNEAGCFIIGNNTFTQYEGVEYPMTDLTNIVLTSKTKDRKNYPNAFYATSPSEAIKYAQTKGFEKVVVIGGGKTVTSFLNQGLIDELVLDIHPLIISNGIPLLGDLEKIPSLELISSEQIGNNQILNRYSVKNN